MWENVATWPSELLHRSEDPSTLQDDATPAAGCKARTTISVAFSESAVDIGLEDDNRSHQCTHGTPGHR